MADDRGQHALTCNHTRSRHARHRQLNEVISRALNSALIPNRLEPVGLFQSDQRRPDGETLIPWSRGACLAWDASCIHRLAQSWVGRSINPGTGAADDAEHRKRVKYADLGHEFSFEPVVVETLGGIGTTSYHFLRQLSTRIRNVTGGATILPRLLQQLGIAIQKGNAGCIAECF